MKSVSMVIPVKNEEKTVQALVDSIVAQTVLPAEVVFVDGGSSDRTRDIIKDNAGRYAFDVRLIELERAYPGEGRNAGLKEAKCDLVAFTDAGIKLGKRWLEELTRPVDIDDGIDVVYGAYEPVIDSFLKECSLFAYIPPRERVDGKTFRTNFIASSLFSKSACDRAGHFPPFRAAEDKIFMENVKKSGAKIAYTDKAIVRWEIPGTIGGIFKRFREFSYHDILAGRAKDWHYSILRTYGLSVLFLALGSLVNPVFFWGAALLWLTRIFNLYYRRRVDLKAKFMFDPRYVLTICFIVLLTDLALFCGSARYLWKR